MRQRHMQKIFVWLAASLALSACAIQDGAREGVRAGDSLSAQVVFNSGDFGDGPKTNVVYASTIEREEYSLFKSTDRQAEFVYITTRHLHATNLVVDRIFDLESTVNEFRYNQSETPVTGKPFRLKSNGIVFWAKSFQLPEKGRACAALSGSWDHPADDLRPSKVLFGYFCETGKSALTQSYIESQINEVGIRGITSNRIDGAVDVPVLADIPTQQALEVTAQGKPGGHEGNINFPHRSVWYFSRDESCRRFPDC